MAGTKRPYILTDTVALAASADGEARLSVGANERFEGHKLLILSTGNFEVRGMKNDSGLPYTNADSGDPLTQANFPDDYDAGDNPLEFDAPIIIEKADALIVQLTDTSAASNTVRVTLYGTMESVPT
jgi:hypothetical protein